MKASPAHLPPRKRAEPARIVETIRRGGPEAELFTFLPIFPQATPKEKNRFELLRLAYVDARYDKTYKITRAELEYLAERVQKLKTITQRVCKKKIKKFVE
jgi:hypothetical protein